MRTSSCSPLFQNPVGSRWRNKTLRPPKKFFGWYSWSDSLLQGMRLSQQPKTPLMWINFIVLSDRTEVLEVFVFETYWCKQREECCCWITLFSLFYGSLTKQPRVTRKDCSSNPKSIRFISVWFFLNLINGDYDWFDSPLFRLSQLQKPSICAIESWIFFLNVCVRIKTRDFVFVVGKVCSTCYLVLVRLNDDC